MGARRRESGYTVLARELRTQILQGRYADGRRLPTEAELAERYRVSRQTVRRAFQALVAEGMVYRVPGRGTFATPRRERGYLRQFGSIDDLMGLSADTRMQIIAPLRRRVDVNAAGRLRLPDDVVHVVVFRRLHEGTPFFANEPILEIVAPIGEAQLAETFLMNQVHYQTVAASKAARIVHAAAGRGVVDFGMRRMHGTDAALKAARAFHIAGVDSTSDVLAGRV